MKKFPFYKLINNLYEMSYAKYLSHLKKHILFQDWFKKACKEKKIRIRYLSKNILKKDQENNYFIYENNILYFQKFFILIFDYEKLENDNHLKLLNINIKNETIFKTVSLLFLIQKKFMQTNYYQDVNIIDRKIFIKKYIEKYNLYLDASILSKILNNITFVYKNKIYHLKYLFPRKSFLYSLYIKDILNNMPNDFIKGDKEISEVLYKKYNIKLSRRSICRIRNKNFISKVYKKNNYNSYAYFEKFYNQKKELNKENLKQFNYNTKGVYELSSNKLEKYSHSKNYIIYIGSSKDIKKRLLTYTEDNAHSNSIKSFIKNHKEIYFRVITTVNYQKLEMLLINSFIEINGELPKLNKQRILNINYVNE